MRGGVQSKAIMDYHKTIYHMPFSGFSIMEG
jgi:hypothetical protein